MQDGNDIATEQHINLEVKSTFINLQRKNLEYLY